MDSPDLVSAYRYTLSTSRDGRIRTGDPLNPIQVRYRTAPRPEGVEYSRGENRGLGLRRILLVRGIERTIILSSELREMRGVAAIPDGSRNPSRNLDTSPRFRISYRS